MDVRDAVVVVDNLTNDVRGTHQRAALTPDELVFQTDKLRRQILAAGAASVIICEVKPMQHTDVTPYNSSLHDYLLSLGGSGYGIETQIRLEFLRNDGFHVKREYAEVIDKMYACAIMGIQVPCPTPKDEFVPIHIKRRREEDWPALSGRGNAQMGVRAEGQTRVHGWRW